MADLALIVEDGSCVENANTFIDAAYLDEFACKQLDGKAIQEKLNALDPDDLARILFAAMEELKCMNFCGTVLCDLPFPRDNCEWLSTIVPSAIKQAQAILAIQFCNQLNSGSAASASGGVILKSMKIKDNSFTFLNGAKVNFGENGECSPEITEAGDQTNSRTDKLNCILAPFLRKKVMKIASLKICNG